MEKEAASVLRLPIFKGSSRRMTQPALTSLPLWKRAIYASLPTVVILLLVSSVEVGLRLSEDPQEKQRWQRAQKLSIDLGRGPADQVFEFDSELFWRLKKNVRLQEDNKKIWWGQISDRWGYRSPNFVHPPYEKPGKEASSYTNILAIGDSTTFSEGVSVESSWPFRLQNKLNRRWPKKEIQVLNAGVPGYTSHQGVMQFRRIAEWMSPAIVLINYGNNDASYWGGRTDRELSARADGGFVLDSALIRWLRKQLFPKPTSNKTLWHGDELSRTGKLTARVPRDQFRENLLEMITLSKSLNATPVLMIWPFRAAIVGSTDPRERYHKILYEVSRAEKVSLVDLTQAFKSSGKGEKLYRDGIHGSDLAMPIAARVIESELIQLLNSP